MARLNEFFELISKKIDKFNEAIYKKTEKWDNIENFEGGK